MSRIDTVETEVFTFDELDENAKERARDWYREDALDWEWWDCTYSDAESIGLKITGFDLGRAQSIEAHISTKFNPSRVCKAIIEKHGKDCDTFKFAAQFFMDRHTGNHYFGYGCAEDFEKEFCRALSEEYWHMLNREMEYLLSNESVDESIRANEYEFEKSGKKY
jgi:hypothetical protein